MPFAADVDRFAPPTRAVWETAAAKVPSLRTSAAFEVAVASTLKSAGRAAVADVPIESKFWVAAVVVDSEIAAKAVRPPSASNKRTAAPKTIPLRIGLT